MLCRVCRTSLLLWRSNRLCKLPDIRSSERYIPSQPWLPIYDIDRNTGGNGAGAVDPHGGPNQHAGALGKKKQFASAMVLLFKFLAYTFPIFGAWIAETKIGRYRAILYGVLICGLAHIIQIFGALPSVLQKHQGLAPFLISIFILAIGAGKNIIYSMWMCLLTCNRNFQA